MKNILFIGILIFTVAFANAQETEKKSKKEKKAEKKAQQIEATKALIENNTFTFYATSALPSKGRTVNLEYRYSVTIKNDTIISYLPFYGRAYSVAYGGSDSGFDFTQPIIDYSVEERKKGYLVKVKTKNGNDNIDYTFNISETGSASLSVTSTNRQGISYHGNVGPEEEVKKEKKKKEKEKK